MQLYPVCWRSRTDCEPIDCLESIPEGTSEEDMMNFNYQPASFVCSGCVSDPKIKQDKYRLCFKNHCTDEISDNDMQDLTSVLRVVSSALAIDSIRKVSSGIVEIPAEQAGGD